MSASLLCTCLSPLTSWRASSQPFLFFTVRSGGRASPLPRLCCPHAVPVLGLDGRSGSNWHGPRLALCAGLVPCQLIGTASSQQRDSEYAGAAIDGWILVSGKLLSDTSACTVNLPARPQWVARVFSMYVFILICSKHFWSAASNCLTVLFFHLSLNN